MKIMIDAAEVLKSPSTVQHLAVGAASQSVPATTSDLRPSETPRSSEPNAAGVLERRSGPEAEKESTKQDLEKKRALENPAGAQERVLKAGKWEEDEHARLLEGLHKYGNQWQKVQAHVGTRTTTQIRSHTQKHFSKQKLAQIRQARKDPNCIHRIFAITREYHNRMPVPTVELDVPDRPRQHYYKKSKAAANSPCLPTSPAVREGCNVPRAHTARLPDSSPTPSPGPNSARHAVTPSGSNVNSNPSSTPRIGTASGLSPEVPWVPGQPTFPQFPMYISLPVFPLPLSPGLYGLPIGYIPSTAGERAPSSLTPPQ